MPVQDANRFRSANRVTSPTSAQTRDAAPARGHDSGMDGAIPTSDHSGEMLNAGAPSRVTYIFEDGHRRTATLTLAEVAGLRHEGIDQTTAVSRLKSWINPRLIITWAFALLASTLGKVKWSKQRLVTQPGRVVH